MERFMILNNNNICTLPTDKKYDFKVLKACFAPSGAKLQLMIALESVEESERDIVRDIIMEEFELNSPLFEILVSHVYPAESHEVIDFDLEDITMFSGTARIKKDLTGKVGIDWECVEVLEALFSSANKYRIRNSVNDKVDDSGDSSEESSQCVILPNEHICSLPVNLEYELSIIRATFSPKGDSLQMMLLLENKKLDVFDVVYEEIPINSNCFDNFVHAHMYGMYGVVDFSPSMLKEVKGIVSLTKVENEVHVDWDSDYFYLTPKCKATEQRLEWLKKDAEYCMRFYKKAV